MRRALLSLPAAAFVLLLTGCGDPTSPADDPAATVPAGSPSSPAPATTSPTATSPTTVTPGPPAGSTPAAGRQITVEGMVEAGVEPGCKVLKTATGEYLLLGDVPLDVQVRITGVPQVGVSTTCQQGTPLRVVTVQRR